MFTNKGKKTGIRKHNIINDGRKENGINRSIYGSTNGKCNNCNAYAESCFCRKTT